MERRYRLLNKSKGFLCEMPENPEGLKRLKSIRGLLPHLFKNARIYSMLQALPDKVSLDRVYKVGESHGWKPEQCVEEVVKAENEEVRRHAPAPHLFRNAF